MHFALSRSIAKEMSRELEMSLVCEIISGIIP